MNSTESSNRETRQILESRLSSAQSRLQKDTIRTAYLELAKHDIRTGRDIKIAPVPINAAHKDDNDSGKDSRNVIRKNVGARENNSFAHINGLLFRAMDFSTSKLQTAQIGLLILESALNAGNFVVVRDYADRTEATLKSFKSSNNSNSTKNNTNNDANIARDIGVKVQIAKGIERMVAKDYKTAANVLIPLVINGCADGDDRNSTSNSGDNNSNTEQELHMLHWPGVTCPEDVALYAGLLCLVTKDRSRMVALADDPEALALVPAIKELLVYYFRCQYDPCMRAISGIHATSSSSSSPIPIGLSQPLLPLNCVVDLYLTEERWNTLVQTIRENCIVDYLRPFQRVKLQNLNNLFFPSIDITTDDNTLNLDPVIDTLLDLMDRKLLPKTTRLDCRENIIFQVPPLENPSSYINLMEEHIMDNSHAMMVRLACLEHDLVYRDPSAADAGFGGIRRGHKTALRSGRRFQQPQPKAMGGLDFGGSSAMADSSDDDEDDGVAYFDAVDENHQAIGDSDTHMVDAEAPAHPAAMNPEDLY